MRELTPWKTAANYTGSSGPEVGWGWWRVAINVSAVEYFYTRVLNNPDAAFEMLSMLASEGINVLAFSAVPFGPNHVELTIFPDPATKFHTLATRSGWTLTGPQHAILVQGDDHLGTLAEIHQKLRDADVDIYASTGVTDGNGRYGYVIYTNENDHRKAVEALA